MTTVLLKGITLQSLGGVFIATLVGLLIAMITLAFEVYMQKKKEKKSTTVDPFNDANKEQVKTISGFSSADKMDSDKIIQAMPKVY